MAKTRSKRTISGIIHRRTVFRDDRGRLFCRAYSSPDTAFMRLTGFLIKNGRPGDVCEITHRTSGRQIGTVSVTNAGTVKIIKSK